VVHLQSVADTPALREAYTANLPRITDFMTRLGADAGLCAKTRAIAAARRPSPTLPAVRRKAVADALRDFELGGARSRARRAMRFAAIQARCADLSQRFGENVLDATDDWHLDLPPARLAGLPGDVLQAARERAREAGIEGGRLTLHAPCRLPVLATAEDREVREAVYVAYAQIASEQGPAAHATTAADARTDGAARREATLLGRASYAELSLAAKMAREPQQVLDFLRDLAARARPFAERELDRASRPRPDAGHRRAAALGPRLVAEKLKQARHGIDDEALRPWFPLPRVLAGLFALIERLLGVQIVDADAPAWHADVRHHRVLRDGQESRPLLARPVRPPRQAERRLDGRGARALAPARRPAAEAVGASGVQLRRRRSATGRRC
jgi:oligopeptidase A